MIPKIIHYCWFGGNPLGEQEKKYIDTWKKYCPDFEIKRWMNQRLTWQNSVPI
jgi:mannosyltransferase OCH1-like enzyme